MKETELLQIIAQAERGGWKKLDLAGNDIAVLPPEIGRLKSLEKLILGKWDQEAKQIKGNRLTTLPPEITQLTNLQLLYLDNNQISLIPDAITQLTNLQKLYLNNNQISVIPDAIAQLTNLQLLYLDNNQISLIPDAIAQLTNLQYLSLNYNQISLIPDAIAQLTNLQWLSLSSNQISLIPEAIAQLTNLQLLSLDYNQISLIPDAIAQLTNLQLLSLRDNPLPIPPEILENYRNPAAIINYWLKLKGKRKPLNEAKVILVGYGAVGKTSLVKQLIDNNFNEKEAKTEGINIRQWGIKARNQTVKLRVWDFGGQEIMHATHQFFLTERSLYLLVLNTRKDQRNADIEYWLKLIQTYGRNAPILVIGNKCDESPLDLDEKGLKDKYSQIKDIISTSCKTGKGIDKLRTAIVEQIDLMDHVFDDLPLQWFRIKEQLEKDTRDYISYNDYQKFCQNEEITDINEQETLIKLLHDLGIVLNFKKDPRLEDTSVLNPEWVTKGVYRILNDNQLMTEYNGQLTWETCQRILKPQTAKDSDCYSTQREKMFILDMMQKFKLSFPLDNNSNPPTYLIPDLFKKSEPDTGDWENSLNFQYRYTILPNSIISRFIVEMYQSISQHTFWRTGVVLKSDDNNRAYVKADLEDGIIFIRIIGNPKTRRSFLSTIRSNFQKVHKTFPGIESDDKFGERVPLPDNPKVTVSYKHLLKLESTGQKDYFPEDANHNYKIRELLEGIEESRLQDPDDDTFSRFPDNIPIKSNNIPVIQITNINNNNPNTVMTLEPPNTPPKPPSKPNLWSTGTFFLLAIIIITALGAIISHYVPWYFFPIILIFGILGLGVVGAFILRYNGELNENNFLTLMIETYRRIPLLIQRKSINSKHQKNKK